MAFNLSPESHLNRLRSLLACALTGCVSIAAAQVYECTDAAGARQFAQFCPPGTVQQRQVSKAGEAGEAARTTPKSIDLQGAEFKLRAREREEAEEIAAENKT